MRGVEHEEGGKVNTVSVITVTDGGTQHLQHIPGTARRRLPETGELGGRLEDLPHGGGDRYRIAESGFCSERAEINESAVSERLRTGIRVNNDCVAPRGIMQHERVDSFSSCCKRLLTLYGWMSLNPR